MNVTTLKNDRPLLSVRNLRASFDTSRGSLLAVDDVSFDLARGETLGIVGESGSGKSVLVRSIMNLLPRNAQISKTSEMVFAGRDLRQLTAHEAKHLWGKHISMVFQDPMTALNPTKRIGTQLTETIRYHLGLNRNAARERAIELLNLVKIPAPVQRLDEYPHELSGGMRQRVVIAIALSCDPDLLICDEPTTALDVTIQREILDLLAQLQADRGMAMIMITHDLGVVSGRSDRVAVMYGGQLQEVAKTTTLFSDVRHPYTEALLESIPKIDAPSHTRLDVIAGAPPDMVHPPSGCRFAERCRYAEPSCSGDGPPSLRSVNGDAQHSVRCLFPLSIAVKVSN